MTDTPSPETTPATAFPNGAPTGSSNGAPIGSPTDDPTASTPGHPDAGPAGSAADATMDLLTAQNDQSLMHRMGIMLTEVTPERIVATMPVAGNTQPYGLLHGGASVVLAETLGSIGSALHAGPGRIAVGIEINATHHRAARKGLVTGTARPVSLGGTLACWEIVITDEDGNKTCTSRITCLLRDTPPGS